MKTSQAIGKKKDGKNICDHMRALKCVFDMFTGNQFASSHFPQSCRTWKDENSVYRLFDNIQPTNFST